MEKMLLSLALVFLTFATQAQWLYWSTNLTSGSTGSTNGVITTNRWYVTEITATTGSGGGTTFKLFDSDNGRFTNYVGAYMQIVNTNMSVTNTWTNTTGLIMTNIDTGIYRHTNLVAAALTVSPVVFTEALPASATVTRAVDLVTVRGLAFTNSTTNVSIVIKYRPWN